MFAPSVWVRVRGRLMGRTKKKKKSKIYCSYVRIAARTRGFELKRFYYLFFLIGIKNKKKKGTYYLWRFIDKITYKKKTLTYTHIRKGFHSQLL